MDKWMQFMNVPTFNDIFERIFLAIKKIAIKK